jgi:predicted nucleic acid-binding protein
LVSKRAERSGVGLKPCYLGDTSALARLTHPAVAPRLAPLLESGLVARCTPTDLEAGYASPSPAALRAMRQFRSAWPLVAMNQPALDRAVEVQDALASRSQQRGAKIADLLIAAAAEAVALVVLHYDRDFDLIATVTGQPMEWIVPAGTVP